MPRFPASVRILLLYPDIRKKGLANNWFVEENETNRGQSLLQVAEVSAICGKKMEEMKCPPNLQKWYKNRCASEMGWRYSDHGQKKYCKMTADPVYKKSPPECLEETFKGQLQKRKLLGHYFEYKKETMEVACHGITKWKRPAKVLEKLMGPGGTFKTLNDGEAMQIDFDQLGFWKLMK